MLCLLPLSLLWRRVVVMLLLVPPLKVPFMLMSPLMWSFTSLTTSRRWGCGITTLKTQSQCRLVWFLLHIK